MHLKLYYPILLGHLERLERDLYINFQLRCQYCGASNQLGAIYDLLLRQLVVRP